MSLELTADLAQAHPPESWREPATHYLRLLENPWYRHVYELTDLFHTATVDFWRSRGGRAAYLPITTGSVSSPMGRGSDSSPVRVELEGVPTYLADSMQFPLELACRLSDGPAYYVMPSFRGEAADQTHLCQFFHSEAELIGGLDECIATVEDYVRHLATVYLDQAADLVGALAPGIDHLREALSDKAFQRIHFADAVRLLDGDPRFVRDGAAEGRSLTRAGERRLMQLLGEFTWVTHMDHLSVPFYQAFADGDRGVAANGDLLMGIGETVGCGERHESAAHVREALALHEVEESAYAWYVRMREVSPLRTAGFGMGVERFLLWLLQHEDIRDIPLLLRFNGQQINP